MPGLANLVLIQCSLSQNGEYQVVLKLEKRGILKKVLFGFEKSMLLFSCQQSVVAIIYYSMTIMHVIFLLFSSIINSYFRSPLLMLDYN